MKNKKAYIIYQYDEFKKDFTYIKEYYSIKELQEKENIHFKNKKAIYQFIFNNGIIIPIICGNFPIIRI